MFTVRVCAATEKSVAMRDFPMATKREALDFIARHGKLSTISRFDKLYIITPSKS